MLQALVDILTILLSLIALILSLVALIVTILGFFASLFFYRNGVSLQREATVALTGISEKTNQIQDQVGGIFDKTLDAALSGRKILNEDFKIVDQILSDTKDALLKTAFAQVDERLTQVEQEQLEESIEEHISRIRQKLAETKETAEDLVDVASKSSPYFRSLESSILTILRESTHPVSFGALVTILKDKGITFDSNDIRRSLRSLVYMGLIRKGIQDRELIYSLPVSP